MRFTSTESLEALEICQEMAKLLNTQSRDEATVTLHRIMRESGYIPEGNVAFHRATLIIDDRGMRVHVKLSYIDDQYHTEPTRCRGSFFVTAHERPGKWKLIGDY